MRYHAVMKLRQAVSFGTAIAFVLAFLIARSWEVSLLWATLMPLVLCPFGVMCAWGFGNIAESLLETEETVQPTWAVPGVATWLAGSVLVGLMSGMLIVIV